MHRILTTFTVLLLAAAPAAAETGLCDALRAELLAVRADRAGVVDDRTAAKVVKKIDKLLSRLDAIGPGTSLADELKTVAKVGKVVEKQLSGEGDLLAELAAATAAYEAVVRDLRDEVAGASALLGLEKKAARSLEKSLKKMNKALDRLGTRGSLAKDLKFLAKAAKAARVRPQEGDPDEGVWVVTGLSVAPSGRGIDLDGDGRTDNNLGLVAGLAGDLDLDALLADQLAASELVLLLQMWWVDDWNGDDLIAAGVLNGLDTDGDPGDNASGVETFTVQGQTDDDGHALLRVGTSLDPGGSYTLTMAPTGVEVPGFEWTADVPLGIAGNASPARNDGVLGFAVPLNVVAAILEDQGISVPAFLLAPLADLDVDGDGTKESVSGALAFTAAPARLDTGN